MDCESDEEREYREELDRAVEEFIRRLGTPRAAKFRIRWVQVGQWTTLN